MAEGEGEETGQKDRRQVSPLRHPDPRNGSVPGEDHRGYEEPEEGDLPRPVRFETGPDARERRRPEDDRHRERRHHPRVEPGALHPAILNQAWASSAGAAHKRSLYSRSEEH